MERERNGVIYEQKQIGALTLESGSLLFFHPCNRSCLAVYS